MFSEDEIEDIANRIGERDGLPSYSDTEREPLRRLINEAAAPLEVPWDDDTEIVLNCLLDAASREGATLKQVAAEYAKWFISVLVIQSGGMN